MSIRGRIRHIVLGLMVAATVLAQAPAQAAPWAGNENFAADAFYNQWARTDHQVVRSNRTWYWGPSPWFDYYEFYRESPNGLRQVQYFDKARMEINNPNVGAVTNGLLVVEMVGGQQKLGDSPYDNLRLPAAEVPVAGDPPADNSDATTYASFASVATINDPNLHRDPERIGQSVGATLDRVGNKGYRDDLARTYAEQTEIVQYNTATGHNIPRVFWNFLQQSGPIYVDGYTQSGRVVDWVSAMGYPIADSYWVRTRVGGVEKDVLVQLFERRVLTYTPSNSPGYQVEMGNVGQHYFQWRYPHLGQPWLGRRNVPSIYFASNRGADQWEVYAMAPDGNFQQQFVASGGGAETVAYSLRRVYGALNEAWLLVDSHRGDGEYRQIYTVSLANGSDIRRITYTDGTQPPAGHPYQGHWPNPGNDFNASISPDGTKIAFVSDRTGAPQIFMMAYNGGSQVQLTHETCTHLTPSWSSDGRSLIWMADCDGDFEIYKGDLAYQQDGTAHSLYSSLTVSLVNVVKLTNNDKQDQFPRYSPDGKKVVFQSDRDGNFEIYVMNADGNGQTRLTTSTGDDYAPAWSPLGTELVFSSNRDGDWEIYRMNADGTSQTQLTNNTVDDHWVVWEQ